MMKSILLLASLAMLPMALQAQFSKDHMQSIPFNRAAAGDKLSDIHSADFNKDGRPDIVIDGGLTYNQSGQIEHSSKPIFLLNNGTGRLVPAPTPFTHASTSSMISDCADYNLDGYPDMLVYDFWANGMRLYNGGPGLSFTLAQTLGTGTHGAKGYFIDIDKDNDLDIVNVSSGSAAQVMLHVFENNGGNFTKRSYPTTSGAFAPTLFMTDLNKDGRTDILVMFSGTGMGMDAVGVCLQNPDKTFSVSSEQLKPDMRFGSFGSFAYYPDDINQDGVKDLVFLDDDYSSEHTRAVYCRATGPYFAYPADLSGPAVGGFETYSHQMLVHGDIDLDGTEDIVTCKGKYDPDGDRFLVVIRDPLNKKGNFIRTDINLGKTDIKTGGEGLALLDLDGDGDLELLSLGMDDTLRVFNNTTLSPTGIRDKTALQYSFHIYPNPTSDLLFVQLAGLKPSDIMAVKLYSVTGAVAGTVPAGTLSQGIHIGGLASGNYVLSLELRNGDKVSRLFNKSR